MNDEDTKNFLLIIINILIYVPLIIFISIGGIYSISYILDIIYGDHVIENNYFKLMINFIMNNIGRYEVMMLGIISLIAYLLSYYYNNYLGHGYIYLNIMILLVIFLCMMLFRFHFLDDNFLSKYNIKAFNLNDNDSNKLGWLFSLSPLFRMLFITLLSFFLIKLIIYKVIQFYLTSGITSNLLLLSIMITSIILLGIIINIPMVKEYISSLDIFKGIYNIQYGDRTIGSLLNKFIYNILNTNKNTLTFLMVEFMVIFIYMSSSYLLFKLYKLSIPDANKSQLLSNRLLGIDEAINIINNDLRNIYNYENKIGVKLPKNAWDIIIERGLYKKDENNPILDSKYYDNLLNFLSIENKYILTKDECMAKNNDYGMTSKECNMLKDEYINYIRDNTYKIIKLNKNLNNLLDEKYKYINKNIQSNILNEGIMILKAPKLLNKSNTPLNIIKNKIDYDSHNFSISLWINILSLPPNTNKNYMLDNNILNLGNHQILYNGKKNILKIRMNNGEKLNDWNILENIYKTFEYKDLKLQKWNNIVLNYANGTLDIFINGNLIDSIQNNTLLLKHDDIYYGEDNGIHGYIKLITYWPTYLSAKRIHANYHSLK